MATINVKKIFLADKWPGSVNRHLGIPTGGFDSTVFTCATSEVYPIGTKIAKYVDCSGLKGEATMIYLRYYCMSDDNGVEDISSGYAIFQQFCNSTCVSADGTAAIFTCTNTCDIDTGYKCGTNAGVIAIACGTLSDNDTTTDGNNAGSYGWFWCGGVCPVDDITIFDGQSGFAGSELPTAGGVAAGKNLFVEAATTAVTLDGGDMSTNFCGWAVETDA